MWLGLMVSSGCEYGSLVFVSLGVLSSWMKYCFQGEIVGYDVWF